jgi:hypothetical protein
MDDSGWGTWLALVALGSVWGYVFWRLWRRG